MKRLDFVQKRCETPRPTFIEKTRSFFKVTANAALVAGLALMPMVLPVKGQDTIQEQKQASIRQVPINDIKKYVAEAEKCKINMSTENNIFYSAKFSDSTEVTLSFFKNRTESAPVGESGNLAFLYIVPHGKEKARGYTIPLSELKAAYKDFTGKELKYVRVGLETGKDDNAGDYLQFYIIPVASKGGDIATGTPMGVISYALSWTDPGAGGCDNKNHVLVSMK